MKGVLYPRQQHIVEERAVALPVRRVDATEEVKLVELKDGKKVHEKPHRAVKQKRGLKRKWR